MAIPVITALITAFVSLTLALGKIIWDAREKRHERRLAAREQRDRYRALAVGPPVAPSRLRRPGAGCATRGSSHEPIVDR
jgi:hypothetical protein